jgi:hypothetical protein
VFKKVLSLQEKKKKHENMQETKFTSMAIIYIKKEWKGIHLSICKVNKQNKRGREKTKTYKTTTKQLTKSKEQATIYS